MLYLHHDSLNIDETHVNLMRAYHLWVETVRASERKRGPSHGPEWEPSDIDIIKSRLFWRIRSGYLPLPWAPPCAFSCPWYEVVEDMGNHSSFETSRLQGDSHWGNDVWFIAQTPYDHIETIGEDVHIVGYGEYRFQIHRDVATRKARRIADTNPHSPDCEQRMLESMKDEPSRGWFIRRTPEREIPQPELKLTGWAATLKRNMSEPIAPPQESATIEPKETP